MARIEADTYSPQLSPPLVLSLQRSHPNKKNFLEVLCEISTGLFRLLKSFIASAHKYKMGARCPTSDTQHLSSAVSCLDAVSLHL